MNNDKIINCIAKEVEELLRGEGSGHDWWHVYRVWKMAENIGQKEGADMFVVSLAALLHDIADWKFHDGDDTVGPQKAKDVMLKYEVDEVIITQVCEIIYTMSYKGAGVKTEMKTVEGKVVQDADRLDAIGVIGIARAFAYGGSKNRILYDPNTKPVMHNTKEEYVKAEGTTVNHFYEKLLLLKERMNTNSAKELAAERHLYMEKFLERFYLEWEGER